MGFFDSLKSMTNSLTGGAADVSIRIEASEVANVIHVYVTANIGNADIKVDQVYLLVKSIESIDISARDQQDEKRDHGHKSNNDNEDSYDTKVIKDINIDNFIFEEQEFQIEGAQTLNGNETYNWTYELKLTGGNIQPSYNGKFTKHQWFFQAGLSARGNDPDSGWQSCELK